MSFEVTPEQFISLGEKLLTSGVSCVSPGTGMLLIDIKVRVDETISACKADPTTDPILLAQLERYSSALNEVSIVSLLQQKLLLDKLERLVNEIKKES